jgi:6-hydroxymethylpterin diphosphokinase MptE-like
MHAQTALTRHMQVASRPELLVATSGKPSLRINGILVHSIEDPESEARNWARGLLAERDLPKDALWVVFGVGLGYHLQALRECGIHDILAFEPNRRVATLWRTNNLTLPTGDSEIAETMEALWDSFRARYPRAGAVQMMALPAYARLYPRQLTDVNDRLNEYMQEYQTGRLSERFRSRGVSLATIENMPSILACQSIQQLRNLLTYPTAAAIIGPGPHLDATVRELTHWRERFLVLAAAQHQELLIATGITPDLTLITDTTRFDSCFQEGSHDFFSNVVLRVDCHPSTAEVCAERKFFYYPPPNPLAQKIYALRGEDAVELEGQSATHVAFNLALAMGADPIVLIGQTEPHRLAEVAAKQDSRPHIEFDALLTDLPEPSAAEQERVLAGLSQLSSELSELTRTAATCFETVGRCRQALAAGEDIALAELDRQEKALNHLLANHPEISSVIHESLKAAREQGERQSDDLISNLELSQILYEIIEDGSGVLREALEHSIERGANP